MKEVAVAIHAKQDFDIKQINHLKNLDYIHVDVMDGKFVNNRMMNLDIFRELKEHFDIPIIAHMMVETPSEYVEEIIKFIDMFFFHIEINENIDNIIIMIKKSKKMVGLVINPPTSLSSLNPYLERIDFVLVMGVNPGWSGQKFINETIDRVNELTKYKQQYQFKIDVDGGVNLQNAKKLFKADILSSSSTILKANNPNEVILLLKNSDKTQ
jgi:ribulose-phosphate 3-epimerase